MRSRPAPSKRRRGTSTLAYRICSIVQPDLPADQCAEGVPVLRCRPRRPWMADGQGEADQQQLQQRHAESPSQLLDLSDKLADLVREFCDDQLKMSTLRRKYGPEIESGIVKDVPAANEKRIRTIPKYILFPLDRACWLVGNFHI